MTRLIPLAICLSITAVIGTILAAHRRDDNSADPTDAAGDYGFVGPERYQRTIPIVTATGATIRLRVTAPNGGN